MESSVSAADSDSPSIQASELLYRCVCSCEFFVDSIEGGQCPDCQRTILPEAIRHAMRATVTVGNIDEATALQFDAWDDSIYDGKVLGHFTLEKPLGRGGMGAVYRALDNSLQRYVAVKVMREPTEPNRSSEGRISSILQEAIAQARLNHPNVVTIYYVGRQEQETFLAMELVSGPTLSERLKLGALPYNQVIQTAIQVADALRHAHQFAIVHADIKPSNLLICGEDQIKLSDFGLSRINVGSEGGAPVAGTPAYLAPEIMEGKPVSIQSDMYALGVTLFELTFGRSPYESQGTTLRDRLKAHQTAVIEYPLPWPKKIPRAWQTVLDRLMSKDPENRYENYDSLLADLRKLRPASTMSAGLAPRLMAYAIDQLLLLLAFAPFAYWLLSLESSSQGPIYSWAVPLIVPLTLIVPGIYVYLIGLGFKSFGRYLFQLQVVDQHGLPLRRGLYMSREVLRCFPTWLMPVSTFAITYAYFLDMILNSVVIGFLLCEGFYLMRNNGKAAFHDLLCNSHVVLDFKRHGH